MSLGEWRAGITWKLKEVPTTFLELWDGGDAHLLEFCASNSLVFMASGPPWRILLTPQLGRLVQGHPCSPWSIFCLLILVLLAWKLDSCRTHLSSLLCWVLRFPSVTAPSSWNPARHWSLPSVCLKASYLLATPALLLFSFWLLMASSLLALSSCALLFLSSALPLNPVLLCSSITNCAFLKSVLVFWTVGHFKSWPPQFVDQPDYMMKLSLLSQMS